ncbi:type 1 glutamine amidotransferase domain-containing protein [Gilvimarinus algae]|uniref:Type 1 glutamine amidotransferase domain-containing protein n=1 Tax=Gilvimarinus algae TaxID=3058037 RepID=A0ABT8TGI3_9GAMM|nr:type 1 glutamine amidotransferase domain-containing protein [Gilvimarinus sp. SDUM040014]MDO3383197.1 type 1 glutamine amidotransferase domain-containing protein [Gilvimarinus sp. SDUM040014]
MIKKIGSVVLAAFAALLILGLWLSSLLEDDSHRQTLEQTRPEALAYLRSAIMPSRGKILAVVTSTDSMGASGRYTGYELTELARAYYVFTANGFEVDIASPAGGEPPAVIDTDDMGAYDYAFINDAQAQRKLTHSLPLAEVNGDVYEAVYFVGGKGAMFDFPGNGAIQALVRRYFETGKVIGAVCHGPAALVEVTLSNGRPLVEGRRVSGFTNEEELLLIPGAREIFPFLLQEQLTALGARFYSGPVYLNTISQDKNLLTGQNPWSVWSLAEAMISQLGYRPLPRELTGEEHAVAVLERYETLGNGAARAMLTELSEQRRPLTRNLIAMHSIVALMQLKVGKAIDLVGLVWRAKQLDLSS